MKIAALLTCHNRRKVTLACLKTIFAQDLPPGFHLEVFLTDDNSMDGTATAVREYFPEVHILSGDGSLFWNGGMRLAFEEALKGDYEFFFWVNDDTLFDPGTLKALLCSHAEVQTKRGADAIVVGTTRSPEEGGATYGGVARRSRLRRTRFSLLEPEDAPLECETMNGNCVLIPRAVAARVGNLDATFVHGMGDFDYGLRARAAGFSIWVMPGFIGICAKNSMEGTFFDRSLPSQVRWRQMLSPKGLPPREWRIFCRRHAGFLWPLFFLWPYLRLMLQMPTVHRKEEDGE